MILIGKDCPIASLSKPYMDYPGIEPSALRLEADCHQSELWHTKLTVKRCLEIKCRGRDCSVGIATGYGLDGPGI
jgi:hypothetical protein